MWPRITEDRNWRVWVKIYREGKEKHVSPNSYREEQDKSCSYKYQDKYKSSDLLDAPYPIPVPLTLSLWIYWIYLRLTWHYTQWQSNVVKIFLAPRVEVIDVLVPVHLYLRLPNPPSLHPCHISPSLSKSLRFSSASKNSSSKPDSNAFGKRFRGWVHFNIITMGNHIRYVYLVELPSGAALTPVQRDLQVPRNSSSILTTLTSSMRVQFLR